MYPSDKELIEKAKQKDKYAFTALFDRYKDKILAYLTGYLGDREKAKDVAIEAFLSAYKSLHTYKGIGTFSSWLYTIATNKAKRELRKKMHYKEVSMDKPIGSDSAITLGELIMDNKNRPDFIAKAADLKEFIYKLLSELDEKYKKALLLCDFQGLSYEEAAEILKSNPVTIGTRVRRGRKKLYKILKKYKSEI